MSQHSEEMPESSPSDRGPLSKRHGGLTLLLLWLVFVNGLVACTGPFMIPEIRANATPDFPVWVAWAIGAVSAIRLLFIVALFFWQRWGFYGYALGAAVVYAMNVYGGASPVGTSLEFCGTIVLFLTLHVGGQDRAWPRLK